MADPRERVVPGGSSNRLWLTVALVTLTALYAVLQVGAVRPHLPGDPTPS